jgi:hypothetical protein
MDASVWDKAAVVMSGLALVISIVMPIIGYYWLDPKLQELRYAPMLKVTKVCNNEFLYDNGGERVLMDRKIGVMMKNEGRLPAEDIKVVFHSDRPVDELDIKVTTEPPSPYKVEKVGNSVIVVLDRAIGNGQIVGVKLTALMNDIETWVYSNQGAERITSAISSASAVRID